MKRCDESVVRYLQENRVHEALDEQPIRVRFNLKNGEDEEVLIHSHTIRTYASGMVADPDKCPHAIIRLQGFGCWRYSTLEGIVGTLARARGYDFI